MRSSMAGMDVRTLLDDGFSRSLDAFEQTLDGIDVTVLNTMPGGDHNSIAWLAWHAGRQADVQIADLSGGQQVWSAGGWVSRFGLDLPADAMGYGQSIEDVAKVQVHDPGLLVAYLREVIQTARDYVRTLDESDLDAVIDDSWDPPVTRGVRLISIIDDGSQHAGQAAYVRGLLQS